MSLFIWRVTPDDGEPYIVKAGSRDLLAWEKQKPGRSAQQMQENFHIRDAYWLAHRAATRAGRFDGTVKEFEESVDLESGTWVTDTDGDSDEDGADPTLPAP